jgi:O-antigen/teichoic acid export membrane protein
MRADAYPLGGLLRKRAKNAHSWFGGWARDSGLMIASQASVTLVTSITTVVLARALSPADFGKFSGFLGLSQSLSVAVDVGLATWLLRELSLLWTKDASAEAERAGDELLRGALSVNFRVGLPLVLLTGGASVAAGLPIGLATLGGSLVLYVVLIAMSAALEAGLRARRQLRRVVLANVVEKTVLLVMLSGSLALGFGLWGVAASFPVGACLRVLLDYRGTLGHSTRRRVRTRARAIHVIRSAFPFAANAAAFSFIPRLDVPMLALISATSAAAFALSWQVFTTLVLIPVIGSSTLYPFIARHSDTMSLQRIALAFGGVGVVVAGVTAAAAPTLLPLIFGAKYQAAVPVLEIMLIAVPLVFYANGLMVVVYSGLREGELTRLTIPSAVIGSGAVLAGQIVWGTEGAAAGLVLRYVLFTLVLLFRTREGVARRGLRTARRITFPWAPVALGVCAVGTSVVGGFAIASGYARAAIAIPLVLLAAVTFGNPKVRTAFVIIGGLFVLQSSSGVSGPKIGYAAGLLASACFALGSLRELTDDDRKVVRSLAQFAVATAAVLLLGLVIGVSAGQRTSAIVRDATTYGLYVYTPLFVIDALLAGAVFIRRLAICAGALAVANFVLAWVHIRGYASTPELGLASFILAALFFAYAIARSERDGSWMLVAGVALAAMLATGTRSAALFLLAPAAMILLPTQKATRRIGRTVGAAVVLVACVIGAAITGLISGASLSRLTGSAGNQSLQYSLGAREGLFASVNHLISTAPIFGHGLGTTFSYTNAFSGDVVTNLLTSDTILTTVARFGWFGFTILVFVLIGTALLPWRLRRRDPFARAAVGALPFLAAYSLLASPFEDKGLSLGLMLFVGASAATRAYPKPARMPERAVGNGRPRDQHAAVSLQPRNTGVILGP